MSENIIPSDVFERKDAALNILHRLKGQLGAVCYLMGGDKHSLAPPVNDFESWFQDIQERLEFAIDIIGDIGAQ